MGTSPFVKSGDVFWRKFAQKKLHLYYHADTQKTSFQKINFTNEKKFSSFNAERVWPEILEGQGFIVIDQKI